VLPPILVCASSYFPGFAGSAHADLVNSDFLTAGDKLLVIDTDTNLQWLSPSYTTFQTYDDAFVQNLITSYGFRYATENEVLSMINTNFNSPPIETGTPAGFADAQQFFNVFGINQQTTCRSLRCPRTQGLTSTSQSTDTHDAVGMLQLGSNGSLIQGVWPDWLPDPQVGSWLVRTDSTVGSVPEPGSVALLATIVYGLTFIRRARARAPKSEPSN
jgi:hypothetical protein